MYLCTVKTIYFSVMLDSLVTGTFICAIEVLVIIFAMVPDCKHFLAFHVIADN